MTYQELLELAAKAEGHSIEYDPISGLTFLDSKFTGSWWNPLHNDGDALRLAVKLATDKAMALTWQGGLISYAKPQAASIWSGEDGRIDPYAATRRAIVRAAAEIGRTL